MSSKITVTRLSQQKHLPEDFLRKELGLDDIARGVSIPYYDVTGQPMVVKERRQLTGDRRFHWPKGQALAAYGLWRLDRAAKAGFLILVEGESDCWALWHHSQPALGIPGANAAKVLEYEHVEAVTKLFVHQEPGEGGEKFVEGVRGRLAALGWQGRLLKFRMPEGVKDPAELHERSSIDFAARLQAALQNAEPVPLPEPRTTSTPPSRSYSESQTDRLLALATGPEYFHTPEREPFATVSCATPEPHLRTYHLRFDAFAGWLGHRYFQEYQRGFRTKPFKRP